MLNWLSTNSCANELEEFTGIIRIIKKWKTKYERHRPWAF